MHVIRSLAIREGTRNCCKRVIGKVSSLRGHRPERRSTYSWLRAQRISGIRRRSTVTSRRFTDSRLMTATHDWRESWVVSIETQSNSYSWFVIARKITESWMWITNHESQINQNHEWPMANKCILCLDDVTKSANHESWIVNEDINIVEKDKERHADSWFFNNRWMYRSWIVNS